MLKFWPILMGQALYHGEDNNEDGKIDFSLSLGSCETVKGSSMSDIPSELINSTSEYLLSD